MDIFLFFGVIMGFFAVIVGMIVKGADVLVLLNPAAAIIIIIGTSAAVMNSFPKNDFLEVPKIFKALFREEKKEPGLIIKQIVEIAQITRKNGLLSLENNIQGIENKFMKKGLEMIVDGSEPTFVSDVLNVEIESMEERHRVGASIFTTAGGAAPTLGVLGAVIGLIGALGNLNDIEKLGHMIAAAFVATLYGIFFGYVICHPFASRMKRKSNEEINNMYIMLEGMLMIQEGKKPKSIEKKLVSMLKPRDRIKYEEDNNSK